MTLEVLIFIFFNSLLYGMFLFMLSSGLTLIFGMMGVLNFAHASFFMLGAYIAYQINSITNSLFSVKIIVFSHIKNIALKNSQKDFFGSRFVATDSNN